MHKLRSVGLMVVVSLGVFASACGGDPGVGQDVRSDVAPDSRDAVSSDIALETGEVAPADSAQAESFDAGSDSPHIFPTEVVAQEVTLGAQPVGGICTDDDDCEDEWCVEAYYGGYCSAHCELDADCPQSSVYGALCLQSPETHQTMCWKRCQWNGDCRSDQFCDGFSAAMKMCVPKCQPDTCKQYLTCNLASGRCESVGHECIPKAETCNGQDPSTGLGVDDDCNGFTDEGCGSVPNVETGVDWLDLGYITTGGGGLSYESQVPVPADAISLALVALAKDNRNLMFWTLIDPNGLGLLNGSDIYLSLNRTYPGEGATTLLVPNNPGVQLVAGTYRFALYNAGDVGPVQLAALFKRGAEPSKGTISFNYYFVGLSWMNATKAASDGTFQNVIEHVANVYAQAGITVDGVSLYDIGGAEGTQYSYLDLAEGEADERQKLLKLSAAHPDSPAVNVFFVADIQVSDDYSGYFDVLGIAGGIPGPPLFQGTNGSGVVVDLSDYHSGWMSNSEKAIMYGEVIAHEVGHQLGLSHTTEQNGKIHDQLADTPECTKDNDGDGFVDGYECWNSGATNLMFWQATGSVTLSAKQGWVLRRNPAVR